LQLSDNKRVLTVNTKIHVLPTDEEAFDFSRVETYSLAEDGMSLVLHRISTYPDGKQEIVKAVYNKQK